MLPESPWSALPPEVADVLRPELPRLADEIITEVSEGVPDYARPMEGPFGAGLRLGVEEALRQFAELVERPGTGREAGRDVYVNLGRGEMLAGRSLDSLLAAYRLGARVAWRRLAAAGEAAGLDPRTLYLLAESIFAYIDELSAESIEGYAREQAAAAGEQQRMRRRLATLLLQEDPPADGAAIETAAADAGWRLPRTLAALAARIEARPPGPPPGSRRAVAPGGRPRMRPAAGPARPRARPAGGVGGDAGRARAGRPLAARRRQLRAGPGGARAGRGRRDRGGRAAARGRRSLDRAARAHRPAAGEARGRPALSLHSTA